MDLTDCTGYYIFFLLFFSSWKESSSHSLFLQDQDWEVFVCPRLVHYSVKMWDLPWAREEDTGELILARELSHGLLKTFVGQGMDLVCTEQENQQGCGKHQTFLSFPLSLLREWGSISQQSCGCRSHLFINMCVWTQSWCFNEPPGSRGHQPFVPGWLAQSLRDF